MNTTLTKGKMYFKRFNIWYLGAFVISTIVALPVLTVFSSFFETTSQYSYIIKETFLYDYIFNSLLLPLKPLIIVTVFPARPLLLK